MKLHRVIQNVLYIYFLKNIYLQRENDLLNLNTNVSIPITQFNGSLSKSYFYKIGDDVLSLFDLEMNLTKEIFVKKPSAFQFIDECHYMISTIQNDKKYNTFYNKDKIIDIKPRFFGSILNQNFRINFPDGTLIHPNKFTCSDLLGKTTYWEYECEEGFQAKNNWIVRGDYLLFCINKQGYFAGKVIKINIKTGVIKWQIDVPYTDMIYEETQGLFISFWAGNNNGKNYQLIDIDNETLEIGQPITDLELANVNTFNQLQYLKGSKLFFADNIPSYGNNTVPIKFGCFDIVTKKVIFLQEIPVEYGIQISQIIYNEDKLYIRMTVNTLLIYEDD